MYVLAPILGIMLAESLFPEFSSSSWDFCFHLASITLWFTVCGVLYSSLSDWLSKRKPKPFLQIISRDAIWQAHQRKLHSWILNSAQYKIVNAGQNRKGRTKISICFLSLLISQYIILIMIKIVIENIIFSMHQSRNKTYATQLSTRFDSQLKI